MNVIYNSSHFWVFLYPAEQGFELFDKTGRRTLFLHGPEARHFCQALEEIPLAARDEENLDRFLEDYCSGAARPIVFH